jgi:hypothetical protein
MSKIICFLHMCLKPSNKSSIIPPSLKRNQQYINGLKSIFKYNNFFKQHNITIFIFDNSIDSIDDIPKEILSVIPENVIIETHFVNKYGKINKGAGVVETWLHNIDKIRSYDYLIHFEPRQTLISNSFIENFCKNPRNIFTCRGKENINRHFNTGLFTIKITELLKFISIYTPEMIARDRLSIEYILYKFYKKNKLEYDVLDKMDLIWYPAGSKCVHW